VIKLQIDKDIKNRGVRKRLRAIEDRTTSCDTFLENGTAMSQTVALIRNVRDAEEDCGEVFYGWVVANARGIG
jgi:hypothetical protein